MGIKRYILLSTVFILIVGLYVYSFNGESYHLEPLGMYFTELAIIYPKINHNKTK